MVYLPVGGNVAELPRACGFRVFFPEVNALQCALRKVAGEFILRAEEQGYSPDVCGYVKSDMGLAASGGSGPFGTIPKPDILLCTTSGCSTTLKWFEALAGIHEAPLFVLDVPSVRDGAADPHALRYVVRQVEELASVLEKIGRRKPSRDRLAETLERSRQAEDLWMEILDSARAKPSPFDAFFEAVFFMAPITVLRGTPECVEYYRAAREEVRGRVAEPERRRIVVDGPPPWPHFRAFRDLFKRWGARCVASTYVRVGGDWDEGFRHDPSRPFESMAEFAARCYTNRSLPARRAILEREIRRFDADALVIHSVRSCRPYSVGQACLRVRDVPTLFLESDLADPRHFNEGEMRTRVDAFFEVAR